MFYHPPRTPPPARFPKSAMKKYILLLALCSASFACKKNAEPAQTGAETTEAAVDGSPAAAAGTDADGEDSEAAPEDAEDAPTTDGSSDANAEDTESDTDALALTNAQSEVRVTSAGAAPRRVLAFDLAKMKPGSAESVTDITTKMMGETMIMPRMITDIHARELKVVGDKLMVTMEMSDQRYEERSSDQMHQMMLASMKEAPPSGAMTVKFSIDAHGMTDDFSVTSTNEELEVAMNTAVGNIRNMSSNLPLEAVGVGATWTTTTRADLGGSLSLEVVVHSTLVELSANSAVIELRFEAPDFIKAFGDENLADLEGAKVSGGSLTGSGRTVVRFDTLLSESEQVLVMMLDLEVEGQKATTEMTMDIKVRGAK